MKRIFIENYRGWDISFSPADETFLAYSNDFDESNIKKSFSATKKYIDDFIKENNNFKPVWVEKLDRSWRKDKKIKLIGIRKDQRFVFEGEKGKIEQLSEYSEKDYFIFNPDNQKYYDEIDAIEKEMDALQKKITHIQEKKVIKEDLGLVKLKAKYSN
jgi:hypothetical protein